MQLKRCFTCKTEKPLTDFWPTKNGKGHSNCRPCANAQRNAWYRTASGRAHQAKQAKLPAKRFGLLRYTAKKRGFEFTLTKEQFIELIQKACDYCHFAVSEVGVALDRKDSSKGYTFDNVVPCCGVCNQVKNDVFNYDEMKKLGTVIQQIRTARPLGRFERRGRPALMSSPSK